MSLVIAYSQAVNTNFYAIVQPDPESNPSLPFQ